MRNPVLAITNTATGQVLNALVGPVQSEVGLTAAWKEDPPSGDIIYEWSATPPFCVDLGEPITSPDFKRVVTLKTRGSIVVKVYDENGFYLYSNQVVVDPT